jgi:hypothetical protein
MRTLVALFVPLLISTGAAIADAAVGINVGDRVPAFTAKAVDLSGAEPKVADFDPHKTTRPTVYLFVGTQCATTQSYIERLRELEQAYGKQGVDFVYVYPNKTDSSDAKTSFHKEKNLAGFMIDDQGAAVARTFGAQKTAEAVIVGKDGEILYHGAIDDGGREPAKVKQRYVAVALDEHLAGKPVTTKTAPVSA